MSRLRCWLLLIACFACLSAGCGKGVNSSYAALRGDSVNGVRVFIDYLKSQGHRVGASRQINPSLDNSADVIIHFDDGSGLSDETRDWLQYWLEEEPGRDLILVLRSYDAEVDYWNDALARNPQGYTQAQRKSI